MRFDYARRLPDAVARIREAWRHVSLGKSPCGLSTIEREAHKLSGSGTAFGFPEVTISARYLESFVATVSPRSPLTAEQSTQISALIDRLEHATKTTPVAGSRNQSKARVARQEPNRLVFVVDDDRIVAKTMSALLTHAGYTVRVFDSTENVPAAADAERPCAIVMDMVFGSDRWAGAAAVAQIQATRTTPLPVIFISGTNALDVQLRASRSGGAHFLSKPVSSERLLSTVRDLTATVKPPPPRVLVVDDDVCLAEYYALILADEGMQTQVICDPMLALTAIRQFRPELVLLDVHMPRCTGIELATVIRQEDEYAALPIVFLSADSNFDPQLDSQILGGDAFLAKPIQPAHLVGAVHGHVRRARRIGRITGELRDAREEAFEACRAKSRFLATMSHEIRTPLNGVLGMATLLVQSELNPDQREFAETIQSSGMALLTVINDVLDYSKIEAEKLVLEHVGFDLENLFSEVLGLLAERAHGKGLELFLALPLNVPRAVVGDSSRLRQVLLNLVGNAIKFTTEGHVALRATWLEDGALLRVEIEDTGVGLSDEAIGRLFVPFSQADTSTTRKFGGTGLGLAICKQLVNMMGGEIGVMAEPGKGSTFWFTLRLDLGEQPRAPVKRGPTLYLAPKEASGAARVARLQRWSEEVAWACSLEEAQTILAGPTAFETVITDGVSREWVQELAKRESLPPGRRLLLCQGSQRDTVADDPAFDGALSKPMTGRQLSALFGSPDGAQPAQGTSRVTTLEGDGSAIRVLVAEDNVVNQKVITRFLEKLGCDVSLVVDGQQAVDAVQEERFQLVLMDCHMPVLDGYEATERVRRSESDGDRLPIVALTANAMPEDRERCIAAGMDDFLSKPVRFKTLRDAIQQWARAA